MKVGFYTQGNGGAGHLARGLAIERGLRRAGFTGEYRIIGCRPGVPFPLPDNYVVADDTPRAFAQKETALQTPVAEALFAFRPDLLIVDIWWFPLFHILPELDCEAWLILDWKPKVWLEGPPSHPFPGHQYARVIAIEPFRRDQIRETIDPIVICNPDEAQPENALRERFDVPPEKSLIVRLQAGWPGEEKELFGSEDPNEHVLTFSPFTRQSLFPAAEWLNGADKIFCGSGYNAFWEARWMGYFDRTVFFPFKRSIDSQEWRARACATASMTENGADVLARQILG